ncbi:ThiF family adenylyltransferase [Lacipirellula limnantheis]|uniref:Thiamine biosynthesis protein ThiF n=1 Tax=Lacipirellula limnantheis TaxID=2528024 RepID=A0A517TZ07_9BACT|nr:ThiF family adenylyltransferase [Lacipirellula limnantheis]QDT73609.1 thiamine biosynthesis protein ThiF [Lacipirellula limnantheis]
MNSSPDRFARQGALVPRERAQALWVTIIGVGAVGRQAAMQLASLGVGRLQLIDFDRVEPTNLTTQGYRASELHQLKVAATAAAVAEIDAALEVECVADRFRPQVEVGEAVFCCVDSIAAREAIWRRLECRCRFWADARMRGEVIRVLAAADDAERAAYGRTLFPQAEAQSGSCAAQGAIYGAAIAAGLLVHQLARWLRDAPLERDVTLNLWAAEWSVG